MRCADTTVTVLRRAFWRKVREVADRLDHGANDWMRTARRHQIKASREGDNGGRSAVRGPGVGEVCALRYEHNQLPPATAG